MPKPGTAVKWLLAANLAVFVLQIVTGGWLTAAFEARPSVWWQVWRYVTFQFLHGDILHILFNMIGLYFLGMYLERAWGTWRFLRFYLTCGAVAGVCHVLLALAYGAEVGVIGASGGVYAVVLACAVLFPQIRVIVFLFPLPIRLAAALFIGIGALNMMRGISAGNPFGGGISDPAHLGGALAAAVWIWILPQAQRRMRATTDKLNQGAWQRKMRQRQADEAEIDRILRKINEQGIHSLSTREKRTLQNATKRQQKDDNDLYGL